MLKKCLFLCSLGLFSLNGMGQNYSLSDVPGLKNAVIGVSVKSVADGQVYMEHASGVSMQPASLVKLFSTGLALKQKGANFRYKTTVKYSGIIEAGLLKGDILIEAAGDPCLDSRFFPEHKLVDRLVEAIKKLGIKEVEGKIEIAGQEDPSAIPGSWLWEDISNYYAAQHADFNYRDNTFRLEFATGEAGTLARLKSITPEIPGVRFVNQVHASRTGGDNAWIFGGPYAGVLYVQGTLPSHQASFNVKGAMHDPVACFKREVGDKLKASGIKIKNSPAVMPLNVWMELESPPLKEIVYYTNKQSVNLFSEALGKLTPDRFDHSLKKVLNESGIDTSGIILKDACGLSVFSLVPPVAITDFLLWGKQNLGDAFFQSLPLAGADRGLNPYIKNYPALKNNLRAKTGSFSGVRCLAGYITTTSGRLLAFTVMINHYTCPSAELYSAVGKLLSNLVEQ